MRTLYLFILLYNVATLLLLIPALLLVRNKKIILFFLISFFTNYTFCQVKFDRTKLIDPKNNGKEIANSLFTKEVPIYADTLKNCTYLKFGFKSDKFLNANDWLVLKDDVIPYRIDIVYSKYPLNKGIYNELYPLLLSRIQSLFKLDPYLNDQEYEWNKVLQTNCTNTNEVKGLFHGIVIYYRTIASINTAQEKLEEEQAIQKEKERILEIARLAEEEKRKGLESIQISKTKVNGFKEEEQTSFVELTQSIEDIKSFSFIPDSLKKILEIQSLDKQIVSMKNYLKNDILNQPDISLKTASTEELEKYKQEIEAFLVKFPARDSVVSKVFERHPEWKSMLVVNDWTASMYGDGAQVLLWHLLNFEKSGIRTITLFNDGNDKLTSEKKIGQTGGVYTEKPDNIEKLNKMFNYIMLQGTGGDIPENNIEAILRAMNENPYFTEIVLIADNNACVRDIQLTELIGKPVKIIVCGYSIEKGLNPDLVYIAKKTGGGIYTLNNDIENIDITFDSLGKQSSLLDDRFIINQLGCGQSRVLEKKYQYEYEDGYKIADRYDIILENEENTNFQYAKKHTKRVYRFVQQSVKTVNIDPKVFKMKNVTYLNLSNNEIKTISKSINKLQDLQTVNFSYNKIKKVPFEIKEVLYIENLNISHNKLTYISNSILGMNFLRTLDLSYNEITYFDKKVQLKKLEKLNLSNNKLKELTKDIGLLKNLKSLNLSNNVLESLPNSIVNLSNLTELNLKNNRLTKLPTLIFKLKKLQVLNLENNNFSEEEKTRIKSILVDTFILF